MTRTTQPSPYSRALGGTFVYSLLMAMQSSISLWIGCIDSDQLIERDQDPIVINCQIVTIFTRESWLPFVMEGFMPIIHALLNMVPVASIISVKVKTNLPQSTAQI